MFSPPSISDEVEELERSPIIAMDDIAITARSMEVVLRGLDPSKVAGPDGLPSALLKSCSHHVSLFLKLIFVKSLNEGFVPEDWKITSVVPIHKLGL